MKSASTSADWRALAAEITIVDGAPKVSAAALSAFAGRKIATPDHLDETAARKRTPRHLRDELGRAFLCAEVRARGVDPENLNGLGRALGDFALDPLGRWAIVAEADRLAGNN